MGRARPRTGFRIAVAALCVSTLFVAAPRSQAESGALTEVTNFGENPGDVQMFEYLPRNLPAQGAWLVVFMHGCMTQASSYDQASGWREIADQMGWAMVFPQQRITNNENYCWNWTQPDDIVRGKGEAVSIIHMVRYMQTHYNVDPTHVFVTGHSAGGYFTSVMLATYPDVFRAGAEVAGGPYRCETGTVLTEYFARDDCLGAKVDRSPEEWAGLLRMGHPDKATDARPPIFLLHGSADGTVRPKNFTQLVEQWTTFYGIGRASSVVVANAGASKYTHDVYKDAAGRTLVESVFIDGADHAYPGDGSPGCPGHVNVGICASRLIAYWFAHT